MEANAEAGFVKHFVGVFGVDPVFDGAGAGEGEAGGRELDDVGKGYLVEGLVVNFFLVRVCCSCIYLPGRTCWNYIFDCERLWAGRPNLSARRLEGFFGR